MSRNLGASIRDRLKKIADTRGDVFQTTMIRYANERLLYRLSISTYANQFILKGATLFVLWTNEPHRATRDIDFLGIGEITVSTMVDTFRDICSIEEEDGLAFLPDTIKGSNITEDGIYNGIRITMKALLAGADLKIQVDIGVGDAVTPEARDAKLPCILVEYPPPKLKTYPQETVISEKFEAMVKLGMTNSRMKDYFDIWALCQSFNFSGLELSNAIKATFERRQTSLPTELPLGLQDEFSADPTNQSRWKAFRSTGLILTPTLPLEETVPVIAAFLMPPTIAAARSEKFNNCWPAGGPWSSD